MSDRTEAFWRQPQEDTVAYVRPVRPDWRHRLERTIDKVRSAYDALWDVMPAVAAFITLLWLMSVVPNLHH